MLSRVEWLQPGFDRLRTGNSAAGEALDGYSGLCRHRPFQDLAKLANHVAKKGGAKWNGVCDLGAMPEPELDQLLDSVEVGEVGGWAAGCAKTGCHEYSYCPGVQASGCRPHPTAFSVVLERTVQELGGFPAWGWKKSLRQAADHVQSFVWNAVMLHLTELREAVSCYTTRAAEKLRRQSSVSRRRSCFYHHQPVSRKRSSIQPGLTIPCQKQQEIRRELVKGGALGIEAIYRPGYRYVKAGVMLMELARQATTKLAVHG